MREDLLDWIALTLTAGVGPVIGRKLLDRFGFPGAALRASREQLAGFGLREETFDDLASGAPYAEAERQLAALEKSGGVALVFHDEEYPSLLRETHDAPLTLYGLGDVQAALARPCVAVVGARQCSTYGRNAAMRLAHDLATHGVTVVSGLARGIDAAAHEAAVEARGMTIAVMGTGLDDVYPKENRKLAQSVTEYGALLTEFPFEKPPLPRNFPYRNRIIAGLSLGVLVVEAAEQSGSLITARLAMEQGRDVYAVPGNITSGKSVGPNRLIQDGAKLVMDWRDVVAEFSYELRLLMQLGKSDEAVAGGAGPAAEADLTDDERRIFSLIGLDQPIHVDQLCAQSAMTSAQALAVLFNLEMKECVRELPGKLYVRKLPLGGA
jgi:DNA processing protein